MIIIAAMLLASLVGDNRSCSVTDRPMVTSPAALPDWAQRRLPFAMAAAGEPFNASDIIRSDDTRPRRQMICAYRQGENWIVEYLQGGWGVSRKTLTLTRDARVG